eukprot:4754643-Amphidinium_carterae.1
MDWKELRARTPKHIYLFEVHRFAARVLCMRPCVCGMHPGGMSTIRGQKCPVMSCLPVATLRVMLC